MAFFDRQRRPPRVARHRRRPAARRRRRLAWLAFWLRGNRRVADAPAAEAEAGDTARADGADAPADKGRGPALQVLLRLVGALAVAALVFGLGLGAVHLLRSSAHFALRNVVVSPTTHLSREALLERSGLQLGVNLFRLDLAGAQRDLSAEPWIRRVRVRRELPDAVAIDVEEYEARALLALGSLYLTDASGALFKRATPDEAKGLPVVTGIGREAYLADRAESQALIREALAALDAFKAGPGRPPIGELHVDLFAGLTLYTDGGVAVRMGRGDPAVLRAQLGNFDAVWGELSRRGERPAVVFLDNRAHGDHVTVRLEGGGATRGASGTPQ